MIPILSNIIIDREHKITRTHTFFLSLTYILNITITYTTTDITTKLSNNLISNALQTP